jgi:hypothetical protein
VNWYRIPAVPTGATLVGSTGGGAPGTGWYGGGGVGM